MANPKLRFHFREPNIDTNLPLRDRTVEIQGFELEEAPLDNCDAWDAAFGGLVRSRDLGTEFVSIPAFPNRKFRHAYVQVNSAAAIHEPRDLEGKRIGILGWDNTAGIWQRGALQNYFGVDLTRIQWFCQNAKVPHLPAGITLTAVQKQAPGSMDQTFDAMLVAGELDAVLGPNVLPSISRRDSRVHRLFADYKAAEIKYFHDTGIFPISHVVSLKKEFVAMYPEAPVALLKAYRAARDVAFDRIEGSDPVVLTISWAAALMAEQRSLMGENYWAYNLADNDRTLEAMMLFAFQQGVTSTQLDYRDFFDPIAASLPGA